jgi:SH3-like domain-containing protein
MSKHNYSQYSNKRYENKVDTTPDVTVDSQNGVETLVDTVVTEEVKTGVVENNTVTITENVVEPESTTETNSGAVATGVVANCAKLNVRSKPSTDADVVTVINAGDEIKIDVDKSTDKWFKIRTIDGVKGFCMRKFVNANI